MRTKKRLLLSLWLACVAILVFLPSWANADNLPVVTVDTTTTVPLSLDIPAKRVAYQMTSQLTKVVVKYEDFVALLRPRARIKFRDRELLARIVKRMKYYGPEVDLRTIPEAEVTDEYMFRVIAPLLDEGKVTMFDRLRGIYMPSFLVHDHGTKQGDEMVDGSRDYETSDGTIFYSIPY
jgi:hypothetical protein